MLDRVWPNRRCANLATTHPAYLAEIAPPRPSVSNRYFYLSFVPRSRTKCYNLYMFLYSYSYKRLNWWWWCICHPSFLTIRSASNGCEVSCCIFATMAHFSAPICRKPLIILKATTSLPHLTKTAQGIYYNWNIIYICISKLGCFVPSLWISIILIMIRCNGHEHC